MTLRFYINILTITFCLTNVLSSYGQSQSTKGIQIDTSKTAIIPFDKKKNRFHPFDTTYTAASLTQDEIENIDSLLIVAINNYNNSLEPNRKKLSIDLSKYNYRKQLIAATNNKGEKEVYVNCFCDSFDEYWRNRWKIEIFIVADGGQCYFQFKINLTTTKIYDFGINGFG